MKTIALEGADKQGKFTQATMLVQHLRSLNYAAWLVEVPIEGSFGHDAIYKMLKNGSALKFPNTFQVLQFLNRLWFQTFQFKKFQKPNSYIVFDRWSLSGIVYGYATKINPLLNAKLFNFLIKPDITIVLSGVQKSSEVEDVYEGSTSLQATVNREYRLQAIMLNTKENPIHIVDSNGTKEEVHQRICKFV
jgi:thymidylate kinase